MNTCITPGSTKLAVLQAIAEGHALSNIELSYFLGLVSSAVSKHIRWLLEQGFIRVSGKERPSSGVGRHILLYEATEDGAEALASGLRCDGALQTKEQRAVDKFQRLRERFAELERRVAALEGRDD